MNLITEKWAETASSFFQYCYLNKSFHVVGVFCSLLFFTLFFIDSILENCMDVFSWYYGHIMNRRSINFLKSPCYEKSNCVIVNFRCFVSRPYGLVTFYAPVAIGIATNWIMFFSIAGVIMQQSRMRADKSPEIQSQMSLRVVRYL